MADWGTKVSLDDVDAEERLKLYREDRAAATLRWLIGAVALTLITTVLNHSIQSRQLDLERLRNEHELHLRSIEVEQTYLSEFVEYALTEDIDARVRFAHYFSRISTQDDLKPAWEAYYEELLSAKTNASTDGSNGSQIGGLTAISNTLPNRNSADIEFIVLDWTGTSNASAEQIDRWHRSRGWSQIGYHYVVGIDGLTESGRPVLRTPAVVRPTNEKSWNRMVIGIAVNCEVTEPVAPDTSECPINEQQISSIVALTQELADEFDIPAQNILGYGEFYEKFGGPPHKHSNPADSIAVEVRSRLVR